MSDSCCLCDTDAVDPAAAAASGSRPPNSFTKQNAWHSPLTPLLRPASRLLHLLRAPCRQVLSPAAVRAVSINPAILGMYLDHLLPEIAAPGDDHNYGSSAMNDVTALQVGGDSNGTLFE